MPALAELTFVVDTGPQNGLHVMFMILHGSMLPALRTLGVVVRGSAKHSQFRPFDSAHAKNVAWALPDALDAQLDHVWLRTEGITEFHDYTRFIRLLSTTAKREVVSVSGDRASTAIASVCDMSYVHA
jgi:hypothetical protein